MYNQMYRSACSLIFYHPDYTVGSGISPESCLSARGLAQIHGALRRPVITAGGDLHPALKICVCFLAYYTLLCKGFQDTFLNI